MYQYDHMITSTKEITVISDVISAFPLYVMDQEGISGGTFFTTYTFHVYSEEELNVICYIGDHMYPGWYAYYEPFIPSDIIVQYNIQSTYLIEYRVYPMDESYNGSLSISLVLSSTSHSTSIGPLRFIDNEEYCTNVSWNRNMQFFTESSIISRFSFCRYIFIITTPFNDI